MVVPYEAFVLHARAMRALLEGLLGLRVEGDLPPWYDGDVRHYVSPELRGLGLPQPAVEVLVEAGYWSLEDLAGASDEELLKVPGIGAGRVAAIRKAIAGRPE